MVPPSHFPLLAEEKSLCAGGGVFFAAIMRASRGGRLFLYGEYYLRGMCGGVGAGGGPAGPAAAGGRTRPKAAEPAPQGRAALRAIGWGLRGMCGGQYLRRSGDVITLIRSMHFT